MNIDQILEKYKPIIYFHSDEKYFPCDADYFIKNSHLIKNNKTIDNEMNQTKLSKIQADNKTFIQPINDSIIYGFNYNYQDAPLYYFVRDDNIKNKIFIYFFLFFAYNGSYNILNIADVGSHYNDIEHFTYQIDKNTGNLERIFFSAHGSDEGMWKNTNEIEFVYEKIKNDQQSDEQQKRPVLYCAKNGHGFYYKPGCIFRFFGFANDLTNKGHKYSDFNYIKIDKPEDKNFNPELYGWFYSNIRMGFDGTKDIYKRNYLLDEDKGASFQKIIPVSVYDFSQNFTYLVVTVLIMYFIEKYFNIQDRLKKTIYITFIFIVILILLKFLKQTINKI